MTLLVAVRLADGKIFPELVPTDIVAARSFKPCTIEEIKPAVLELEAMRKTTDQAAKQAKEADRERNAQASAQRKADRERTVCFIAAITLYHQILRVSGSSATMK